LGENNDKRFDLLQTVTKDQTLDITCIYSIVDQFLGDVPLIHQLSIQEPHHTISRAQGSLTFPANFQLVAAMNP
jgi:predicted ATPase with chaperone activity